jgi:hypothetical protein
MASAHVNSVAAHYGDVAAASQERERLGQQGLELASASTNLDIKSPLSGIVLSPRANEWLGTYVVEGTELMEVGDLSKLHARVYLSEPDMHALGSGQAAKLQVDGMFGIRKASDLLISPASTEIEPGLIDLTKYQGLRPPRFYVADLQVENADGRLKPGLVGTARIYGQRKSLAGLMWSAVQSFVGRKIW